MRVQEQTLDERRADCRIWAHMLFWWLVPFGLIISASKMRYGIPAYVMLGAHFLAVVTTLSTSGLSIEKQIAAGFANGQKYGLFGSVIGSGITVREILESRRKIKA